MSRSSSRMPCASISSITAGNGPPRSGWQMNVSIAPALVAMSRVCSIINAPPARYVCRDEPRHAFRHCWMAECAVPFRPTRSLRGRHCVRAATFDIRPRLGTPLVEPRHASARVGMRDVVRLTGILLCAGPALLRDVEDHAGGVGVFHFVAALVVRIAHDPGRTDGSRCLAAGDCIVDPQAEMMQADIVLAGALRRPIVLEL